MGLRSTIAQILARPTTALLDRALRQIVEEAIDARGLVHRSELAAAGDRIDAFRRELTDRRGELAALKQSLEAFFQQYDASLDEDLDLFGDAHPDPEAVARIAAGQTELSQRLERAGAALQLASAQVEALAARATTLDERAEKAARLAHAAQGTAEAAADGVTSLETRLASR